MEEKNKLKRQVHPDRVTLSTEALDRINGLLSQLHESSCAMKITRADLVDFLILNHASELSEVETKELEHLYFDEVKFAAWALNAIKAAKARGETLTLQDLVKSAGKPKT